MVEHFRTLLIISHKSQTSLYIPIKLLMDLSQTKLNVRDIAI